MAAFSSFGLPLLNVTPEDFARESLQYMIGRSPVLFDFLTPLPGLDFARCWERRLMDESEGFPVIYLSKPDLIQAKTLAGRPQDLSDLAEIRRADRESSPRWRILLPELGDLFAPVQVNEGTG